MTRTWLRDLSGTRGQVIRFLIVGGSNTVLTYAVFVLLGLVIPAWIAFTVAFAIGLVWTVFGGSRWVFVVTRSTRRILLYAGWYLLLYGIGQLVIHLIRPKGVVQLLLTSVIVLIVTTPLTFIGGKYIFGRTAASSEQIEKEELAP